MSGAATPSGSSISSVWAWMTAAREVFCPCGQRVDQQVVDAGLLQGDGEREPGRAGADDQHVGVRSGSMATILLLSTMC